MDKLETLLNMEGLTEEELLTESLMEGNSYGICSNKDCNYTTNIEADNDKGYCEICKTNTVISAEMMLGII